MNTTECKKILDSLEEQMKELEKMIAEPSGNFCKSSVIKMFKNNTASARTNGSNILFQAVKEIEVKVKGLIELEILFPSESRITSLKRRYATCGQHLISMINMMEEWD